MGRNNHWLEMAAIITAFPTQCQAPWRLVPTVRYKVAASPPPTQPPFQSNTPLLPPRFSMGAQDRISNEALIPMNSMPGGNTQRDPPPYPYSSLSPPRSPPPTTTPSKTSIAPPPREATFSPIPDTPSTSTRVPTTTAASEVPHNVVLSRERLLAQDARFADVVLTHVILPRAKVGILRCKDKSSFAFIPQTEDDVILSLGRML